MVDRTRFLLLRRSTSLRAGIVAALVTTLVLGSAGASVALWSATATVSSSASTASEIGRAHV